MAHWFDAFAEAVADKSPKRPAAMLSRRGALKLFAAGLGAAVLGAPARMIRAQTPAVTTPRNVMLALPLSR
jgi:hypothetical protein